MDIKRREVRREKKTEKEEEEEGEQMEDIHLLPLPCLCPMFRANKKMQERLWGMFIQSYSCISWSVTSKGFPTERASSLYLSFSFKENLSLEMYPLSELSTKQGKDINGKKDDTWITCKENEFHAVSFGLRFLRGKREREEARERDTRHQTSVGRDISLDARSPIWFMTETLSLFHSCRIHSLCCLLEC